MLDGLLPRENHLDPTSTLIDNNDSNSQGIGCPDKDNIKTLDTTLIDTYL